MFSLSLKLGMELTELTDELPLLHMSSRSFYKTNIAALRETRFSGEDSLSEVSEGFTFFWKSLHVPNGRVFQKMPADFMESTFPSEASYSVTSQSLPR